MTVDYAGTDFIEEEIVCEECGTSWMTEQKYAWRCLVCGKYVCSDCGIQVNDDWNDIFGMVCKEHLHWLDERLKEVR